MFVVEGTLLSSTESLNASRPQLNGVMMSLDRKLALETLLRDDVDSWNAASEQDSVRPEASEQPQSVLICVAFWENDLTRSSYQNYNGGAFVAGSQVLLVNGCSIVV